MKARLYVKQEGTTVPIIMVHGDEANKSIPENISKEIPFYAFYHPVNHKQPETFISIEQYASSYLKKLKEIQPNGPYFLAGYSIGGIIAFEMAQQLKAQGDVIQCLVMLDTKAPSLKGNRDLHNRQLKWNEHLTVKLFRKAFKKAVVKTSLLAGQKIPDAQYPFFLMERYRRARSLYKAKDYDGNLHLLRSTEDNFDDPYLGWQPFIKGDLQIHAIEGNHHQVTFEPSVITVAKVFEQIYNDCAIQPQTTYS